MIALLSLIIGLLAGYWARAVYDKVRALYELWREQLDTPPGVVKIQKTPLTRNQPVDTSSESGGVMRPTPTAVFIDNQKERERHLRINHQ
jgi:hypothetical protein